MESADRVWLELVADLMAAPLVVLPAERVATALMHTLRAGSCAVSIDQLAGPLAGIIYPLDEDFGCRHDEVEQWCREHCRQAQPVMRQYQQVGYGSLMQCADVAERFADARVQARWREVTRPWGAQLAVLGLLADGHTAAAIGRRLGIAERTVHKHLEGVYARMGVHDRLGAVLRARDLRLFDPAAG